MTAHGPSAFQARAGANHRDEATILRDTEHAAKHDALDGPGDHHMPGYPKCACQQCAIDAWGGE